MAYSKQTWVRGEKVASTKLNHMEDGIAAISANGAIDTANLADCAVTNDKIDQEAVDSNNIRVGAIITPLIYDGAVTLAKLADAVKSHFALADDVSEIKSYLEYEEAPVYSNSIPANTWTTIGTTQILANKEYKFIYRIPNALSSIVYCTIRRVGESSSIQSVQMAAGTTEETITYTPSADESIEIRCYTGASGGTSVSVTVDVGAPQNIYDAIDAHLAEESKHIPDYYYEGNYLPNKIESVRENTLVKTGANFVFITDLHIFANTGMSKYLVKNVLDNTLVPMVFCGGDIPQAYSKTAGNEKNDCLEQAYEWNDWLHHWGIDKVYTLRGNHDYAVLKNGDSSVFYHMPKGGVYQHVMAYTERKVNVGENGRCYYYVDDEAQKIRYIVIDGHSDNMSSGVITLYMFPAQITWLINVLNASDGYSIVILTHEACDSEMGSYSSALEAVLKLAKAYRNKTTFSFTASGASFSGDFSQKTGELVCILSGHSHKDESHVSDNVLSISTTCDALYNNDPNVTRTRETVTESAFDVYSIDTTDKTIKTVRIGGGSDRGWNYETGELLT